MNFVEGELGVKAKHVAAAAAAVDEDAGSSETGVTHSTRKNLKDVRTVN